MDAKAPGPGEITVRIRASSLNYHVAPGADHAVNYRSDPDWANTVRHLVLCGLLVGSRQHQRDLVAALNATGVHPVIDRHFALADLANAFRYPASQWHFGKIVVDI